MQESQLRDLISSNINKLKSGLTLLKKEQYIPNELGTKGFIDLYAKDQLGNHILIEIKRSDAAAREALHEVNKYVEGVKQYFGVKDWEIQVIIASTEWKELLIPFSRFANDVTFSLQGYEILVNSNCTDFHTETIVPYPINNGRSIAPWHNIYWYKNGNDLENGIHSIREVYKEKQIDDYVLVILYFQNELSPEEQTNIMRANVAQILGIKDYKLPPLPKVPVYEYIAYVGVQLLTKEKCLQILSYNSDEIESVQEELFDMDEEEALCYLHECVEAMSPFPKNDFYEIEYPAKFSKLFNAPNVKLLDIIRNGSFARNALLDDETIISELQGEDGSTRQKFKKNIFVDNAPHLKILKEEVSSFLSENLVWKSHVLKIIEEIQVEFPNSKIEISIFNPCTGVFTIYFTTTKEYGITYIPSYHIIVNNGHEDIRMYFGALEKAGKSLTFSQILDKYYEGELSYLLFLLTSGGKDDRDSNIIEDLGAQYRSFRCDRTEDGNTYFKLQDDKWRTHESIDPISLFYQYLDQNEQLVRQIVLKISPLEINGLIVMDAPTIALDKLADLKLAKKKNQYFLTPPTKCDICNFSFNNQKYMIDGELKNHEAWAFMCADCFKVLGKGISWGQGQLYLNINHRWLLVGGFNNDLNTEEI